MVGDGRGFSALPSALHTLPEPLHRHLFRGGPVVHVEPTEAVYVLVGDETAIVHDGHEPLLGPYDVSLSYPVQLLDRLSRQRDAEGPAELPLAPLAELAALRLHEPCPPHTLWYRLFALVRGRGILPTTSPGIHRQFIGSRYGIGGVGLTSERLLLLSRVARRFPLDPPFPVASIHPSAWQRCSANFAFTAF